MGCKMHARSLLWVAACLLTVASPRPDDFRSMLHSSRRSLQDVDFGISPITKEGLSDMPALDPPAMPAAAAPGPFGAAAGAPAEPPPNLIWKKVSTRRALLQDSLSSTPSLGRLSAAPAKTAAHSPAPAHAPPVQDPKLVFVFNTPGARRHLLHSTPQVSGDAIRFGRSLAQSLTTVLGGQVTTVDGQPVNAEGKPEPQASSARSRQQDSPETSGSGNDDPSGMTQPSPGTTNAIPGKLVTDPSHDYRTSGYGGTTPSSYQSPHPAAISDPDPTTMPCSRWPGSGCGRLPGPSERATATPGFLQG